MPNVELIVTQTTKFLNGFMLDQPIIRSFSCRHTQGIPEWIRSPIIPHWTKIDSGPAKMLQ